MKNKILNNFGIKVLSCVLAIGLWMVVVNIEDPVITKRFRDVPVQITNESAINSINKVYETVEGEKANFTIRGKRSVVEDMTEEDFSVIADLSHLSEVNAVPVSITAKRKRDQVDIYKNENTLCVKLEDVKTENFPVMIVADGEVAEGHAIGTKEATPNIITVSGAKTLVNRVKEIRAIVDVNQATKTVTKNCELRFFDSYGEKIDATRLTCSSKKVKVKIPILNTKEVKLEVQTVGRVEDGYGIESIEYEPKNIEVTGSEDVLSRVDKIVIPDVDVTGLKTAKPYTFELSDYMPEGVTLENPEKQLMVTVKVSKVIKKRIELASNQVTFRNAQDDKSYNITNRDEIEITVFGPEGLVNSISWADLSPTIEVSGLAKGKYSIDIIYNSFEHVSTWANCKAKIEVKEK